MSPALAAIAKPHILDPGVGERYCFRGLGCRPIVRGEDSGGAYSLVEVVAEPGAGWPLHICHGEDKAIYVVSGIFRISAGAETMVAAPGAAVRVPKGVPHSFMNLDSRPSRLLASFAPAGHERFFEEMSLLPPSRDEIALAELLASFGMSLCHPGSW